MIDKQRLSTFLGGTASVGSVEKLISALGGFFGILLVFLVSRHFLPGPAAMGVVASIGASTVLLFAVPHGALSQPWPVLGGHLISAAVGVTCASLLQDPGVAAALAVSLSIALMYHFHCIHPPGGATALTAVIGGPLVHELGYSFLLTPVLLNVVVILATAFLANYAFAWRRYPVSLAYRQTKQVESAGQMERRQVDRADLEYALGRLGSYVDVDEAELQRIVDLAFWHSQDRGPSPVPLHRGCFYCNGAFGEEWEVRQVTDLHAELDRISYQVVAGRNRRESGSCTREEFSRWVRYQVVRRESLWVPAEADDSLIGGMPLPVYQTAAETLR